MTTMASAPSSPFFVPPKLRTSTPASVVNSRNGTPSAAAAFQMRAPSMCSAIPWSCATSAIARTSAGVYSVPSSVLWVMLTASGCARCSSPQPHASVAISSGVSLPSGLATVRSFRPLTRSGAPPSSVWMCAVAVATTAPQRGSTAVSATTLAPVPLKTGICLGGCRRTRSATTLAQPFGVGVLAVGDLVAAVGRRERLQHLGVHARVVVAREAAEDRCRGGCRPWRPVWQAASVRSLAGRAVCAGARR